MNASQMWDSQLVANLIAPYLDRNGVTHVSVQLWQQSRLRDSSAMVFLPCIL